MSDFPAISDYEVPEDERDEYAFRIYCDDARRRAREKAEADLQRRIDRGDWPPLLFSENGVAYMKRTVPLVRRRKR